MSDDASLIFSDQTLQFTKGLVQNSTQAITPTYQQSKIFQADDKNGMTSANIETNHVHVQMSTTKSDSELSSEFYENLKNAFKDYYTTTNSYNKLIKP